MKKKRVLKRKRVARPGGSVSALKRKKFSKSVQPYTELDEMGLFEEEEALKGKLDMIDKGGTEGAYPEQGNRKTEAESVALPEIPQRNAEVLENPIMETPSIRPFEEVGTEELGEDDSDYGVEDEDIQMGGEVLGGTDVPELVSEGKKMYGDEDIVEKKKDKSLIKPSSSVKVHRKDKASFRGEVIERYEINVDGANVIIDIVKSPMMISYNLNIPKISAPTAALLDEIRNELITVTTISMKELTDPALFSTIKKRFMIIAKKLLKERLPNLDSAVEAFLIGTLMQEMLGLGKIEFLVGDSHLEEIVVPSAKEPIRVYSIKYGWLETNLTIEKEEEIINYANIIARRVGKQITILSPLLDAHLITGDRVNAVLYPINTKGNTITIRKFARDPFTIIDFINNRTCTLEIAALVWLAVEYEMNVLISGGTGSGKTSFLNSIMPFIPPNQRIISIEDTRELMLPDFLYWTPLVTRTPNPEGKGEVSMLDLLINSLRMRPDRIILGEMRRQQEAMVLFEAMHTGHSVCATVHADSAAETVARLINPPLSVPPNLLKAVNLNVVMFRDRKKGIRRVIQIAEFEASKDSASSQILYRWVPETDETVAHSESSRFFEDVSRNTGMSQEQIKKDLELKESILKWLVSNKIRSLNEFGKVMNLYYRSRDLLIESMEKGDKAMIFRSYI